jgi:hypothetical protein
MRIITRAASGLILGFIFGTMFGAGIVAFAAGIL